MGNLRGLLGIRIECRMHQYKSCVELMRLVDEIVLQWFSHIERMGNNKNAKNGICKRVDFKSFGRTTAECM